MDTATWLDQHHAGDLSPLQRAIAGDAAQDARADAQDRQEQAQRAAAVQERNELLALAFHQGGVSPGELARFRVAATEADDEIRDLSARLAKAETRRARAHRGIEALQRQLNEVSEAVAQRSAAPDMLEGAKQALQEHREYVARSRAAWQAAQNGTPARPPFAAGGVAVRNEPVTCEACIAVGADATESFLLHHTDVDGNPLAASPDVPVSVPPDDSERSAAGYGRVISR